MKRGSIQHCSRDSIAISLFASTVLVRGLTISISNSIECRRKIHHGGVMDSYRYFTDKNISNVLRYSDATSLLPSSSSLSVSQMF